VDLTREAIRLARQDAAAVLGPRGRPRSRAAAGRRETDRLRERDHLVRKAPARVSYHIRHDI
jgi:hypothetical protein